MSLCSAIEALLSKRLPLRGKQKAVTPSDRRGFRDWRGFLILLAVVLLSGRVRAEETCGDFPGAAPPVAHLVSSVGEVTVGGRPPSGEAPDQPICAGDLVEVGAASRALVHLVGADTPLRLDENSVTRFYSPPEPGSGLVDLLRGGLYFLSEVRRTLSVRTPYVNAGVEGTEVYLRVADAGTEMIVLEGRVAATPGNASGVPFAPAPVVTGQRLEAAPGGVPSVTTLPDDGAAFGVLRRVTVGALSWTLFYPEVLVGRRGRRLSADRGSGAAAGGRPARSGRIAAGGGARCRCGRRAGGRPADLDRGGTARCCGGGRAVSASSGPGARPGRTVSRAVLPAAACARLRGSAGLRDGGGASRPHPGSAPGAARRALSDAGRPGPVARSRRHGGGPGSGRVDRHRSGLCRSCDLPRRCGRGCVSPCPAARQPESHRAPGPRARPDPARRSRGRHRAAAERRRRRPRQLAPALLPR